ncbi:MAG TPA: Gfo/Idh/MocA family oxidoreductase, partial [Armatimonadaceae bacterium]|nr:Gfo/Idh/MocA family oxidoreductase [Armatimonadaceae bacterium]
MAALRVGIAGKRGAAFAAALRALPGVELTALCDVHEPTLNAEADRLGVEKRFTSFFALLDAVDAVVVATPMHLHASQAIAALDAGKHTLSEVTACVSLEECWRLLDAAQSASQ